MMHPMKNSVHAMHRVISVHAMYAPNCQVHHLVHRLKKSVHAKHRASVRPGQVMHRVHHGALLSNLGACMMHRVHTCMHRVHAMHRARCMHDAPGQLAFGRCMQCTELGACTCPGSVLCMHRTVRCMHLMHRLGALHAPGASPDAPGASVMHQIAFYKIWVHGGAPGACMHAPTWCTGRCIRLGAYMHAPGNLGACACTEPVHACMHRVNWHFIRVLQ